MREPKVELPDMTGVAFSEAPSSILREIAAGLYSSTDPQETSTAFGQFYAAYLLGERGQ